VIRQLRIAFAFLTRLPVGHVDCTARDIGQAARWFSLVGLFLGAVYAGAAKALGGIVPHFVAAVVIVGLDALITGAMHFDGLADAADGFGAGRTRDDVLRIMRDHAIRSYGSCALIVIIAFKVAALGTLIGTSSSLAALLLMPALGRWSSVFSSALAGYARSESDDALKSVGSPARFMGYRELAIATVVLLPAALALRPWRGAASLLCGSLATAGWTWICRRKIRGVTGDTLGAGIEFNECIVLALFTIHWRA